ncbi:unnamed protein product [Colias eurytheme]|nr:unnamed protein product [Colias eurytheme]
MKRKLINFERDLILDAINNYRRVEPFLEEVYEQDRVYHVAKAIILIRSKFSRMVRVHSLAHNNFKDYGQNKQILHMSEVQHLGMDIDNLVQIVLDNEWEDDHATKGLPQRRPRRRNRTLTTTTAKSLRNNQYARLKALRSKPNSNNFENVGGDFDSDIY